MAAVGLVETLRYVVEADTSAGVKGNEDFADSAQKAADKAELARARVIDLERAIARRRGGASAVQTARLDIARRDAEQSVLALKKVQQQAAGVAASSTMAGRALSSMGIAGVTTGAMVASGIAVAGAAVGKFAKDGVDTYVANVSAARDYQRVTGASMEASSRLAYALRRLGVDGEAGQQALFLLGRNIDEHPEKFRAAGVEIERTREGAADSIETLHNLADAYAASSDQAERNAMAAGLVGRGARDLLPFLAQGRAGIEQLYAAADDAGAVVDEADKERVKEYKASVRELTESVENLKLRVGEAAVGPMTMMANGLDELIDKSGSLASRLAEGFDASPLTRPFEAATKWLVKIPLVRDHLVSLSGPAGTSADALDEMARSAADLAQRLDDLARSELEVANATLTQRGSNLSLQRSAISVAQAQQALNDLHLEAEQRARAVADAEQGIADARERLTDATADVAEAQAEYDKVVNGYGASSREAAEAQERLNDAMRSARGAELDVAEAYDNVEDALRAYNEALAAHGQGSDEAQDALRAYERAQLDKENAEARAREATQASRDAQDGYTDAVSGTGPASEAAKAAQEELTEAQKRQRDAARAVEAAERSYKDALDAGRGAAMARRSAELALQEALLSQEQAYVNYARGVAEAAKATAEANGGTLTQAEYNGLLAKSLDAITKSAPYAREALGAFFDLLEEGAGGASDYDPVDVGTAHRDRVPTRTASGGMSITVPLVIDGRVFAEAVIPDVMSAQRRFTESGGSTR